jgi:hypothetical protein
LTGCPAIDPPAVVSGRFTVDSVGYVGKVFSVDLRVHATKTVGGSTCYADSNAVNVTRIVGVDP